LKVWSRAIRAICRRCAAGCPYEGEVKPQAVADGVAWKRRVGWSKVLAGLRVKFPRVRAPDFRCRFS